MLINPRALVIFLGVLAIEIGIARYVHDTFIRPFVGDALVVVLIYYFIKTFLKIPYPRLIAFVLVFSFSIETLQYFHIIDVLGIHNRILRTMIGNTFDWLDLLAYTVGLCGVWGMERGGDRSSQK